MAKKILFVYNPEAGKGKIKGKLSDILVSLAKGGNQLVVHPTTGRLDATALVAKKGHKYGMVVCSGGDGTFSEVIDGLMQLPVDKRPLLGYLPAGTTNDFAISLNIPITPMVAAKRVAKGTPFSFDVGRAGGKFFSYIVAFGAFTDVAYQTPQSAKNVLGHLAYMLEGVKRIPALNAKQMRIEYDGQVQEGRFIFGMITNSTSVGGFKGFTGKRVLLHDGLFEMTLIREPKSLFDLNDILIALITGEPHSPMIVTAKVDKVRIVSEDSVAYTFDGEFGGDYTDLYVENIPRAVTIVK